MRRIKIDKTLHSLVVEFNKTLFGTRNSVGKNKFIKPEEGIKSLLVKYERKTAKRKYLLKIEKEYKDQTLLSIKPTQFQNKIKEFEDLIKEEDLDKSFVKDIITALRYDDYRKKEYPEFISSLGWNVKTCFYCNYAGTLNISTNKKLKTYYDLDHVLPKSKYPFLALSFYNFTPSCASCNRQKSGKIIPNLNPFYEDGESNEVGDIFSLDKRSYAKFLFNKDKEELTINVSDKINSIIKKDYAEIVDLENLYSSQKHVAEELIWKKTIYTDTYLNQLITDFNGLNLTRNEINRMLWGNNLDEETINDRPLSKFIQDILKDLKVFNH